MTELHHHLSTSNPYAVDENTLSATSASQGRGRRWVRAGGAITAATAVAVTGYLLSDTAATTTTTRDAVAAGQVAPPDATNGFSESDGTGSTDTAPEDAAANEITGSSVATSSYVIRLSDGSFVNYVSDTTISGGSSAQRAMRSMDGENWEPVETTGLPDTQISIIETEGTVFLAHFLADDTWFPSMMSVDGLHWSSIDAPDVATPQSGQFYAAVHQAASLPNGRVLISGSRNFEPDLEALGVDWDDVCDIAEEQNEQGELVIDVWSCDDETWSKTFTIADAPAAQTEALVWTVDADGKNPEPAAIPGEGLTLSYRGITASSDGVTALFDRDDTGQTSYRGTTTDGSTWDLEELAVPSEPYEDSYTTSFNETIYRIEYFGDRFERSTDGGRTWTGVSAIEPTDEEMLQSLVAGPAGVVALTSSPVDLDQPFTYVAGDGTRLNGVWTFEPVTWTLTTPTGETYDYHVAGSLNEFPPASDDANLSVGPTDELGDAEITLLDPATGRPLLSTTVYEILDALETYGADDQIRAVVPKDGYVLTIDEFDYGDGDYSLSTADGTALVAGTIDIDGIVKGEGVEVINPEAEVPGLRFFDPATGQDYVTFTSGELLQAFTDAAIGAMAEFSKPLTVSQDGYTLQAMVPTGRWDVANSAGEVIASFDSPVAGEFLRHPYSAQANKETESYSRNPLTNDVTVLVHGEPVVTFAFDDLAAAAPDGLLNTVKASRGSLFFSGDQGATWEKISPVKGWATSVAVGDDEILVAFDEATNGGTPVRIPIATS